MGCNNSHLRPFFRRCRRRRSKKDEAASATKNDPVMIENGHLYDGGAGGNPDFFQGLHFLGSSTIRNPSSKPFEQPGLNESPACVPLLAQSEASTSQVDFFKMLDDKIAEGPDYDPEEAKIEYETHRKQLLDVWSKGIQSFSLGRRGSEPRCVWEDE